MAHGGMRIEMKNMNVAFFSQNPCRSLLFAAVIALACMQTSPGALPTSSDVSRAAARGDAEKLSELIKAGGLVDQADRRGFTPLFSAIASGNPKAVKLLLDAGAKLTTSGPLDITPLKYAVVGRKHEIVELLLKRGANPDTPSVLELALVDGSIDIARLLISWGAKGPDDVLICAVVANDFITWII